MPKLINNQTQQLEDVSYDALPSMLQSGTHSLQAGQTYNLLNPDGHPVNVPAEELYQATQEGYNFPKQAHVDAFHKESELEGKYGSGLTNSLKAFAAGAGRGATLGLSDLALTKSGAVDPETLKELRDRHGLASGLGQLSGITAGLALGTGEAGAAEAGLGALNAPAQLGKLGAGIAENPVVAQALSKYGASALGSAVEGAAYGAGNVVTEHALGDPNLNAEKAVSEIGLSALLGGAIGGAFSTAADLIPASVNKAKALFEANKDPAINLLAKASSAVSGKPVESILQALKTQGDALTPEAAASLGEQMQGSLQNQYKLVNKAVKESFADIRPSETKALLDNTHLPAAQQEAERIFGKTEAAINEIKANPELYPQRYATKLKKYQDVLVKADQNDASSIFTAINDLKKLVDPEMRFGHAVTPELQDSMNLLGGLRSELKNSLENEGTFGPAAARQAAFNEAYNEFSTVQKQVTKDFMQLRQTTSGRPDFEVSAKKLASAMKDPAKLETLTQYQDASKKVLEEIEKSYSVLPGKNFDSSAAKELLGKNTQVQDILAKNSAHQTALRGLSDTSGSNLLGDVVLYGAAKSLGPVGELGAAGYAFVKNPGAMVQRLAAMEAMFSKVQARMATASRAIFKPIADAATGFGSMATPVLTQAAFAKHAAMLAQADDPNQLINKLEKSTQGAYAYAPDTVGAMHGTAATALSFLKSKLPNTDPQAPLDGKLQLSDVERAKYGVYLNAVQNPMSALNDLRRGTLRPETVEALKTVYPRLYQQMSQQVMNEMIAAQAKHKAIPLSVKNGISLFTGNNMTSSLTPASMHKAQQALAGAQPQAQTPGLGSMAPKGRISGLNKLSLNSMAATPMQRSLSRNLKP